MAGTPQRFIEFLLLNVSPSHAQQIEFTVINLLISLSALYLLKSHFAIYSTWHFSITAIFVALIQTWSPYLAFVWVRLQTVVFALIFLQIALALLVRFYNSTLHFRGFLIRFGFLSIALGWSLGTQPPILVTVSVVFLLLVSSFSYFQARNNTCSWQCTVKLLGFSILLYCGFNLWWIYPLFQYSIRNDFFSKTVLQENFDVKSLVFFTSEPTSIFNSLRQLGDFAWFEGYWPQLQPWLISAPYVLASLMVPFILVIGISKLTMADHNFNTFAIMAGSLILIISIFLTLGSLGPTGEIYKWSLDNLPLFSLQRAPWQKFTLLMWLFSPALLFYSLINLRLIANNGGYRKAIPLVTSFILFISIMFSPMSLVSRGEMFSKSWSKADGYHENNNFGFHLKIPKYIYDASDYLSGKSLNSDILLLPDSTSNNYNWGWGAPWDVTWQTVRAGIGLRSYGEGILPPSAKFYEGIIEETYKDLSRSDFSQAANRMETLGISKIVVRNDFKRSFIRGSVLKTKDQGKADAWNQILKEADIWSEIENFGPWTIYLLDQDKFPFARTFYLQELDSKNYLTLETASKLVQQTHSRNIQGSFRKIELPSTANANKVTLKEDTSRDWKIYSYKKIKTTADDSAIYLPWYSNLFFSASVLLNDLPWISGMLLQDLGIAHIDELDRLNATEWRYLKTESNINGVLASFYPDTTLVIALLATFLFYIFFLLTLTISTLIKWIRIFNNKPKHSKEV